MTNTIALLTEDKAIENEALLVFHKIISMLDNGHVDFNETSIRFNVGALIKKGSYSNLGVLIRKGENKVARLGKHREGGQVYIVIETDKLPERKGIDSFLENKDIAKGFLSAFRKYVKELHDHAADHPKHKEEMEAEVNDPSKFEELYDAVVKKVDEAVANFQKTKGESHDVFNKFNVNKQETQKMTMTLLQKEFFGATSDEFAAKYMKEVPEVAHMNKDFKDKMTSRLKSLHASKIVNL